MDGEELANRCLELEIGVRGRAVTLYELAPDRLVSDFDSFGSQPDESHLSPLDEARTPAAQKPSS